MSLKRSPIRIFQKAISSVKSNGGKVVVTYVQNGKVQPPITGRLQAFNPKCIDLSIKEEDETYSHHIPTNGNSCAVQKMIDEKGRFLYRNISVDETYVAKQEKN